MSCTQSKCRAGVPVIRFERQPLLKERSELIRETGSCGSSLVSCGCRMGITRKPRTLAERLCLWRYAMIQLVPHRSGSLSLPCMARDVSTRRVSWKVSLSANSDGVSRSGQDRRLLIGKNGYMLTGSQTAQECIRHNPPNSTGNTVIRTV